jgi:predicted DNA-binding transcriptional regulator AlpA
MDKGRLMDFAAAQAAAGGLSESSLRRLVKAGRFPRPIALSKRGDGRPARIAFVEAEVEEAVGRWIAEARSLDQPA